MRSESQDDTHDSDDSPSRRSQHDSRHGSSPSPLSVRLSSREQAMLQLADGATNRIIADELGLSVHGVKHHVANLLKQLNCANWTEAASTAMRRGLVSTEPARSVEHVQQGFSAQAGGLPHHRQS